MSSQDPNGHDDDDVTAPLADTKPMLSKDELAQVLGALADQRAFLGLQRAKFGSMELRLDGLMRVIGRLPSFGSEQVEGVRAVMNEVGDLHRETADSFYENAAKLPRKH